MLRREGVRDLERPQRVICLDEQQRRSRARRLLGETLLQLLCQRVGDSRSGCQRGDDAALPVLALREHVQRGPLHGVRGGILAEDEQQVAGSGEAVDRHLTGDQAFGLLHVEIARSDDHVDGGHRVGPVGERGDRLGAADAIDFGHAGDLCCGKYGRGDLAARCGHGEGDAADAGDAGRHGPHQHR